MGRRRQSNSGRKWTRPVSRAACAREGAERVRTVRGDAQRRVARIGEQSDIGASVNQQAGALVVAVQRCIVHGGKAWTDHRVDLCPVLEEHAHDALVAVDSGLKQRRGLEGLPLDLLQDVRILPTLEQKRELALLLVRSVLDKQLRL